MSFTYQNLARERWFEMSLAEYLGNIGSEYERAWKWKQKNNQAYFEKAFERMLELFDLTLADLRWKGLRLREIARAREQVCSEFMGELEQGSLSKYFNQFAMAVRS